MNRDNMIFADNPFNPVHGELYEAGAGTDSAFKDLEIGLIEYQCFSGG
jgi:hypothetical protein